MFFLSGNFEALEACNAGADDVEFDFDNDVVTPTLSPPKSIKTVESNEQVQPSLSLQSLASLGSNMKMQTTKLGVRGNTNPRSKLSRPLLPGLSNPALEKSNVKKGDTVSCVRLFLPSFFCRVSFNWRADLLLVVLFRFVFFAIS